MSYAGKFSPSMPWWERVGLPARGLRSPQDFMPLVAFWNRRLIFAAIILVVAGFAIAFSSTAPSPHAQGTYLIIFIHVPAAWVSLALYVLMALWSGAGFALRRPCFAMMAQAIAPTGAMLALLALCTGSLWDRQSQRTWWDVQLAVEMTVFMLYLAIILFRAAMEDSRWSDLVAGATTLAGLACLSLIFGSWSHWPSVESFLRVSLASPGPMFRAAAGLAAVTLGLWLHATAVILLRLRCVVLERERGSDWVEGHRGEAR